MKSLLVFAIVVMIMGLPYVGLADKVVRDRYGRLVETWTDHNGTTDIRNSSGTLEATRTYRSNGTVEIRDRNGTLIGTEQLDHRGK
jgi:hypothetical protein